MVACALLAATVTQAVALATRRDFMFGLIPAFDPAGSRNLIAWLSSMLLSACAFLAILVAAVRRARGDPSGRGWWVLAAVLGLYSVAAMTSVAAQLLGGLTPVGMARVALATASTVVAAVALAVTRTRSSPRIPVSVWVGLVLLVVSSAPLPVERPLASASALVARLLAWTGTILLMTASVRMIGQHGEVSLRVSQGGGPPARPDRGGPDLDVDPAAVVRVMALAIATLTLASLASVWVVRVAGPAAEPWRRFLFVDFEGNLPSWFSALLLLACGAVAGTVTAVARSRCGAEWHDWALVAGGLVALSADEAAALHELLVVPVRELVGGSPWLRFPLILPGTGVVLVAAAALGRFVRHLPSATRRTIVTGSAVFLLGALVIETVGGWFDPDLYGDNVTYVLLVTVEEACEMIGVAIVLVGLLRHIERHVGRIDLRVVDAAAGSDDGGRA